MQVAIIGAGIAGLACADQLRSAGHMPLLFDKARGAGGRMSTRRVATERGDIAFDHGATHFTARSPAFRSLVEGWHEQGLVAPWPIAGLHAWVGMPSMNTPLKAMASAHEICWSAAVTAIIRDSQQWWVHVDAKKFGPFDAVVLAIPAEQAAPLLSLHDFEMARAAMAVRSYPSWSAMYLFEDPINAVPDFIRGSGPIAFAVRNSAKPGRPPGEAWVVQANWDWSEKHLACLPREICNLLLGALGEAIKETMPEPVHADAHRWRYGQPSGRDPRVLWNAQIRLGACGDWIDHGFVELAWKSGSDLGRAMAG
jgi:hypothetical protein